MNEPAPTCVRVNRTKTTREALLPELVERFPDAALCRYAPDGIVLGRKGDVGQDPAFVSGLLSVQDEASQLVVHLLDPQPGDRILDTCSAPGTKAAAIAERLNGEGHVLALDRHARRLQLVGRGMRRLGVGGVATLERDATKSLDDLSEAGLFDRILVDAPCSGLGALRRNPDARWRIRGRRLEARRKPRLLYLHGHRRRKRSRDPRLHGDPSELVDRPPRIGAGRDAGIDRRRRLPATVAAQARHGRLLRSATDSRTMRGTSR
jgi:16S rRNA C967 or C1407 C5-methylase (RsmB/RsmF family)